MTWRDAGSLLASEIATTTMTNEQASRSVDVSLGSRRLNVMQRFSERRAPTTMTSPRTSSALAKIEPRIDVCATTVSPAPSANRTTNSSGRLPSVDCSSPVTPGPKRSPTCSVANETTQARPARATVAIPKASSADAPA